MRAVRVAPLGSRAARAALQATAALWVACAAAPPAPEPDRAPPPLAAPPVLAEASVAEASLDALPGASPDATPGTDASSDASAAIDAAPPALAADDSPCSANAECESGLCEGGGCEGDSGVCASRTRSCSPKLAWFCGCDGKDFQASADCPGRRFAYPARCTSARAWGHGTAPDEAPCLKASQCKSGVCEGRGCDDAHPGTCQPAGGGCGQSAVQYCGCDGRSFASNPCPGVRFESTGFCHPDPRATSTIKVLSVSGKNASVNAELKSLLLANGRLRSCHLMSGEKTFTKTLDFEVDAKGQLRVESLEGLGERGSVLPGCVNAFVRKTILKASGSAARASVKLRFELTRPKP